MIGEPAAECRTENRGESPHGGEDALVFATLSGREDVADDRERQSEKNACADPLNAPEQDQLIHAVERQGNLAGGAAECRRRHKKNQARHEKPFPAVNVGKLGKDRHRNRHAKHVGGGHPRVAVEAREIGDNARLRSPDNRLIERGDEQRQKQSAERAIELRLRQTDESGRMKLGGFGRSSHPPIVRQGSAYP